MRRRRLWKSLLGILLSLVISLISPPSPDSSTYTDPLARATSCPWTGKEQSELADWSKQNEKPLALAMGAIGRPEYFNPLVPKRTDDWSPGLTGAFVSSVQLSRHLGTAFACRAMLRVSEGKVDEAWQDLLACHRLGPLIARGCTLIEMLSS